jgi:hypothetical protein
MMRVCFTNLFCRAPTMQNRASDGTPPFGKERPILAE